MRWTTVRLLRVPRMGTSDDLERLGREADDRMQRLVQRREGCGHRRGDPVPERHPRHGGVARSGQAEPVGEYVGEDELGWSDGRPNDGAQRPETAPVDSANNVTEKRKERGSASHD